MTSLVSDAEILESSAEEPRSFALLYERHAAPVARYVLRRIGPDAAEDLTAEVFARAFRARRSYRPRHDTALPWLLGIAGNVIADHRRAERRRLQTIERVVKQSPTAVEHADAWLAADLAAELRRLPAADRDALLLVVWGELSYEEAALALEVPVGTVRSRIHRARRRLVNALAGAGGPARAPDSALKGEAHA